MKKIKSGSFFFMGWLFCLGCLGFLGACTNRYCCQEATVNNLEAIGAKVVSDYHKFPDSARTMSAFLLNEHRAPLGDTLQEFYKPVNFSDTGQRMGPLGGMFSRQWEEGMENTPNNFHAILQALCLSE